MQGIRVLPASQPGLAELDNRYIKRFVGGVLTADTALIAGVPTLYSPTGALSASIPADVAPTALFGDKIRTDFGVAIYRIGAAARLLLARYAGTYQAPGQTPGGQTVAQVLAVGSDGGANHGISLGDINLVSREAIGPSNRGSLWRIRAADLGGSALKNIVEYLGGGAGIGISLLAQATHRFVPTNSGQLRNPADTVSLLEWNATGIGEYGNAPIARPTITGSRGGNVALANLLTALNSRGTILDSTTA